MSEDKQTTSIITTSETGFSMTTDTEGKQFYDRNYDYSVNRKQNDTNV